MNYHDTHFHLDLCKEPEKVAIQIEQAGIYTIAVTNSPSVFHFTQKLSLTKKYIRAALGLHPELSYERKYEIDQFLELLQLTRYIGEVGLDNLKKTREDYQTQKKIFTKIVEACGIHGNKIMTIHSRRAVPDILEIIGNRFPGKVILHWFSGSIKELEKAVEQGYYFSVNYPMTMSESGKKIIRQIPLDRLLIESDGPFTSYNSIPCTPFVSQVIIDQIRNLLAISSFEQLNQKLFENFRTLIKE